MKKLLAALSSILLSTSLAADSIAVLDSQEAITLESAKGKFIAAFQAFVDSGSPIDDTLPLVNPPEWGKTISAATHGSISYKKSFAGGFVGDLNLAGLEANKSYRLTLNGNPDLAGNDLLPTQVPGLPNEYFYDFLDIVSDENGNFQSTLGIKLKSGKYDVRIYVKDTDDWKIVLYRDYFPFTVE